MSNSKKEDPTVKKKYVFFSDPDIIGQRVEASAAIAQSHQGHKAEQPEKHPVAQSDEKFLLYTVQDCPFPFIGAVKRKLALHDNLDAHKKTHETACEGNVQQFKITDDQYRTIYNMDFIHSLKVPELSIRESSVPKSFHDKNDKPVKSSEKVQRKLDFSMSDSSSIVNSEGIEPLKVPNLSIASNLAKKKEHIRESSREKENRSKRIRKDDVCFTKHDDMLLDYSGRTWSQKRVPRKELSDNSSDTAFMKLKNERLPFRVPKEADAKSRTKNFAMSATKKDSEKRQRPLTSKLGKTSRDSSLETKSKNCSNESISERSTKIPDTITTRDSYNKTVFDIVEYRYKDDCHGMKQIDEQKHPSMMDSRQMKQRKLVGQSQGKVPIALYKELGKKAVEKMKSTSKGEVKYFITNTEESDNTKNAIESNPILLPRNSSVVASSSQQMKQKDNSNNITKSSKSNEDSICANDSLQQYGSTNTNKDDEQSSSHSVMTEETSTKHESNNDSENFSSENLFSEALLDPRRISFRDESRSPQDEFHDLVTPNMNLILRSKRRKQFTQNDAELGGNKNDPKYNSGTKTEEEEDTIQLFHPAALHKQFQAELQLLDSVNESFRKMINVENSLYSVEHHQKKKLMGESKLDEESNLVYSMVTNDKGEPEADAIPHLTTNATPHPGHFLSGQISVAEFENSLKKANKSKPIVKAVEVQTQTVNDIATQTDTRISRRNAQIKCPDICGTTCEHGFARNTEAAQVSLDSFGQFEDLDQIEEISLPSRLRAMSEISLHETTSSIKTETGTEISISTRDVTCSFNKYLNLEIAQLIKDEKQRYDKIEMLFKSREKTLNDRTKKLVKLEEQKRALRDTGQDSRISSVKKKQRALLLKLQQEKDEMNRLKELHKIASQERKLMLQKQRNMFNPHMSTKNILTKLKRSADSSSPRRLSGPMKGYDIRSNSSMSSLVDSDKSQHDRSQVDARLQISENDLHFSRLDPEESIVSFTALNKSYDPLQSSELNEKLAYKSPREENRSKYDVKSKKFEEKMPKADDSRLKSRQFDVEPKLMSDCSLNISSQYMLEKEQNSDVPEILQSFGKSISEQIKSESDTLVEELSKRSKSSQAVESYFQNLVSSRQKTTTTNTETIPEEISSFHQDTKTSKSSQVSEDILQSLSKSSKKSNKSISTDNKDASKKIPAGFETKSSSKRKSSKCQKTKSSSSILTENILRSKSNSEKISEELIKHDNKRTKVEKEIVESDNIGEDARSDDVKFKGSSFQALFQHSIIDRDKTSESLPESEYNDESKENAHQRILDRNLGVYRDFPEGFKKNNHDLDNPTSKSRISTFAFSRHSSEESERNYSKSVVVRSQDHDMKASKKLQQIFNAREAALATRRSYAEEWMAWHAKLSAEEDRVARMEQAVVKLMSATSNVFSHQDTTISSDTSDVEGRIELLTEKLAERRMEMSRLKREARKQTKQKLRAVEANLLHQIKKYDTTIHEMKKKLESKKSFDKDLDRSSAELKLLADFKVPEIPLKKIQDLYKNNDLLRSRSESDLFSTRRQLKNGSNTNCSSGSVILENKCAENSKSKTAKSGRFERMEVSEHLSYTRMNSHCSRNQSILDGSISERIEYSKRDRASTSAISEEILTEKRTYSSNELYATERSKQGSSIETDESAGSLHTSGTGDIKTEINSARSASDGSIVLTEKASNATSKLRSETGGHQSIKESFSTKASSMRTASSQPIATERYDTEYSQTFTELSDNYSQDMQMEMKRIGSGSDAVNYRKSIDSLNINHESLDKNISSLENELKTLEEMVSCLGKKPSETLKLASNETEKCLTEDVSEICTKSSNESQCTDSHSENGSLKIDDASDQNKRAISMQYPASGDDIRKPSTVTLENDLLEYVENVNSNPDAIDYKARSNEILNEIEKSIISEHIKSVGQDKSETGLKSTTTIHEILTHSGVASDATYPEESVDFAYKREPVDEKISEEDNKSLAQVQSHKNSSSIANDESLQEISKINEASKIELSARSNSSDSSEEIPTKTDGVSSASGASEVENISNCSKQRSFPGHLTGDHQDWTTSDSFNIQQNPADSGHAMGCDSNIVGSSTESHHLDDSNFPNLDAHLASDIDASMFIPKGESTKYDISRIKLDDTLSSPHSVAIKATNAAKDTLDLVSIRKKEERDHGESLSDTEDFQQAIRESVTEILDRVERSLENYTTPDSTGVYLGIEEDKCETPSKKQDFTKAPISEATFKVERQTKEEVGNEPITEGYVSLNEEENVKSLTEEIESSERSNTPIVNITLHLQVDNDTDTVSSDEKPKDIVITELDPGSVEGDILPELVIDAKVELAEEVLVGAESTAREDTEAKEQHNVQDRRIEIERNVENALESINEQDSSDGEQRDNLVEVVESELHTIEKQIEISSISRTDDQAALTASNYEKSVKIEELNKDEALNANTETAVKSQDAEKSPEKFDSSTTPVVTTNKTFDIIKDPEYEDISEESLEVSEILEKRCQEKYETVQKSDEVLRILDEITQKSAAVLEEASRKKPLDLDPQIFPEPLERSKPETEIYVSSSDVERAVEEVANVESSSVKEELASTNVLEAEDFLKAQKKLAETSTNSEDSYDSPRDIFEKQEQDVSSDSSEGGDTPRGVPDIEIDSPTDSNDIRLDVDTLNDDSARKNIVAMINELKASMEQPGLEVAELEAKVLRIKELQIELEIKALEAKQVPYYVREIPNKPPPPYTPPSGGARILPSLESFSPPPPVVPSNIEELTAFTDKATVIIYKAKLAGEEIMSVEPPPEIYDFTNDANEVFKRDKRIYNTFLFDLCKEIIADVYQSEYEKPGPSWTKPNVKTKPIIRLPKTVEELNEHVSKEVATLFGFKTKLQRENMVMRWSRKRRDRVDELLAREAQAEEAQWTKFHDDELTLKNHVTVAILDTLILETVKEVKVAYAKKRKIMI